MKEKGFALLIGVVVAGVIIAIAYSMFSVSLKQVELSISGKNSQAALYMADTGIECALYVDNKIETDSGNPFVDISVDANGGVTVDQPVPQTNFWCNQDQNPIPGNAIVYTTRVASNALPVIVNDTEQYSSNAVESTFEIDPYDSVGSKATKGCAKVTVQKYVDSAGALKTHIASRGYNICPNTINPEQVERGLEVYY